MSKPKGKAIKVEDELEKSKQPTKKDFDRVEDLARRSGLSELLNAKPAEEKKKDE